MAAVLIALSAIGCNRAPLRASASAGWAAYGNSLDGQRFAALDQIDTGNVSRLRRVCELRLGEEGPFQTGPVVIGATMFLTTTHTTVAINATNRTLRWRHIDPTGQQDPALLNRGVGYLDGRLFRGVPGARLVALDTASGKILWEKKAGEPAIAEFLSSWHIPQTAERGGGGMWTSYTLDTITGELFVPVGNPAPDFAPGARPSDNLFTNSVVVLDAKSGALKWWYQATPSDGHDYDLAAPPTLYSTRAGDPRVALGSKDGHVYSSTAAPTA